VTADYVTIRGLTVPSANGWLRAGIQLKSTNNCIISNNFYGIQLRDSSNNCIYLNDFINNANTVHSLNSTNIWNSPSKITYVYNGNSYTSYLGNYWDDYSGRDVNGDGIGDTPYGINSDKDLYPLLMPVENYIKQPTITVDTTPPEVICPADVTVELETLEGTVVPLDATATDNCDPNPTIASNELNIYPQGTTTVTFTATDASGNSASCSTNVAVVDTTPPLITNVMVSPTIVSSGTQISISANVFDISKVSRVRAFITKEGVPVATVFMLDPDGDGVYTGTWHTLSSYTEPGIYSIDISATDTDGNEVLVKAPEVEITSEATGSLSICSTPSGATIGL
jgi:hypothetical protein